MHLGACWCSVPMTATHPDFLSSEAKQSPQGSPLRLSARLFVTKQILLLLTVSQESVILSCYATRHQLLYVLQEASASIRIWQCCSQPDIQICMRACTVVRPAVGLCKHGVNQAKILMRALPSASWIAALRPSANDNECRHAVHA